MDVNVYPISISRSDLSNLVERHRNLLSTNHPGFRQTGRHLYDLLVKPAQAYLNVKAAICIILMAHCGTCRFKRYKLSPTSIFWSYTQYITHRLSKFSAR